MEYHTRPVDSSLSNILAGLYHFAKDEIRLVVTTSWLILIAHDMSVNLGAIHPHRMYIYIRYIFHLVPFVFSLPMSIYP